VLLADPLAAARGALPAMESMMWNKKSKADEPWSARAC
jgi:hypothetical protein